MTSATEGTAPPAPQPHPPTGHALRVALAATACLVVVELGRLQHGNLAVWTTHMVMSQYTFSIFQKGVERIVGRGLGIVAGLVVVTLFRDAPVVALLVESVLLLAFFYVYFAGRLAYTFLNAGLYVVAMFQIGHANPAAAVPEAEGLFAQPAHPYTRALVSAIPALGPRRERLLLQGDPPNPVDVPAGCAFHTRCPFATAACRAEAPALRPMADGRQVACHRVEEPALRAAA